MWNHGLNSEMISNQRLFLRLIFSYLLKMQNMVNEKIKTISIIVAMNTEASTVFVSMSCNFISFSLDSLVDKELDVWEVHWVSVKGTSFVRIYENDLKYFTSNTWFYKFDDYWQKKNARSYYFEMGWLLRCIFHLPPKGNGRHSFQYTSMMILGTCKLIPQSWWPQCLHCYD